MIGLLLGGWRFILGGFLAGALVSGGGVWWLRDQMAARAELRVARAEVQQARQETRTVYLRGAVTERVVTRYVQGAERVRTVTQNTLVEVPRVIPVEVDRAYGSMPVGFVRVWNAAVAGNPVSAVPDPAGRPDDARSGIDPSAVAANAVQNFGVCRLNADQLTALQQWIREQAALRP